MDQPWDAKAVKTMTATGKFLCGRFRTGAGGCGFVVAIKSDCGFGIAYENGRLEPVELVLTGPNTPEIAHKHHKLGPFQSDRVKYSRRYHFKVRG